MKYSIQMKKKKEIYEIFYSFYSDSEEDSEYSYSDFVYESDNVIEYIYDYWIEDDNYGYYSEDSYSEYML